MKKAELRCKVSPKRNGPPWLIQDQTIQKHTAVTVSSDSQGIERHGSTAGGQQEII